MPKFIGVDIGGTTSTLAIGDLQRNVLLVSDQFPTSPDKGPGPVIAAIVEQIRVELQRVDAVLDDVPTVGLATPGPASHDGVLHMTPNLNPEYWDQFPIRAELEKALQEHAPEIAVRYIGDGQAAALGEYAVRSRSLSWDDVAAESLPDEELHSLFMVIVGTGLGGGAVLEGQPIRGLEGRAGHVGHILLPEFAFRHAHDGGVGHFVDGTHPSIGISVVAGRVERQSAELCRGNDQGQSKTPPRTRGRGRCPCATAL